MCGAEHGFYMIFTAVREGILTTQISFISFDQKYNSREERSDAIQGD
jgi:hypothetical protein